ncbi:MarR family transcriptional regulator [Haloarcula rubripromontorii]|uniref:MarR family transcriptional regulator n=1 Tax=Haloarcula rubripromontorii TaxID=1705562 RepID=A0A847U4D7_9EURY|nr:helix-turn-helix domain-containing protein [Haloarcula rubripromontorii]NLV07516.1 MarR family transcriptional regulator [Haloarcula rubripromontorii]
MTDSNDEPEWLTDTDKDVLRVLGTELVLSPSIIAENTDHSRVSISRRLNTLQAGGLVEKVDRGKYRITYDGFEIVSEPAETPDDISPDE